jgi:hypothetical protein
MCPCAAEVHSILHVTDTTPANLAHTAHLCVCVLLQVSLSSSGGHSSMPPIDGSSIGDQLARLLAGVAWRQPAPKLQAPITDMLAALAQLAPGAHGAATGGDQPSASKRPAQHTSVFHLVGVCYDVTVVDVYLPTSSCSCCCTVSVCNNAPMPPCTAMSCPALICTFLSQAGQVHCCCWHSGCHRCAGCWRAPWQQPQPRGPRW